MSGQEYWKKLEEIGWVNYLTDAEKKEFFAQLKKNLKSKTEQQYAFLALAQGTFDAMDSTYPEILKELKRMSRGVFSPTKIRVSQAKRDRLSVTFQHNGKEYACTLDELSDPAILDIANKALKETGVEQRFIAFPAVDVWVNLVFVPEKIYKAAVRKKLIPKQEDLLDEEEWE